MKYRFMATVAVVAALSACGGGGGGNDGAADHPISIPAVQDMSDRMDRLYDREGDTLYANLPRSGTARYEGYAVVDYNPDGPDTNGLLGNARLDADFANATISGRLDNFHRVTSETHIGRAYSGALTVSEGEIGSYYGTAAFGARARGTLDGGNDVVRIDNPIAGVFVGDDADGIVAQNAYGVDTMVRNGSTVPVGIAIFGER